MSRRKKEIEDITNGVKREMEQDVEHKDVIIEKENYTRADLIPMGSTLLNLAMSGYKEGGARKGRLVNIIGASHGGKTILALSALTEMCYNSAFKDYELIYDDAEEANDFDMEYMFGNEAAKRIQPPRQTEEYEPENSDTIQKFHSNIQSKVRTGKPFVYIQDSLDALDTIEDQKKTEEMLESMEKGKETAGTYGMSKAKGMKAILRDMCSKLNKTASSLFIISQIIDDPNPMTFTKQTRAGGKALKFFSTHEMWLRPAKKITKGTDKTVIGNRVRVEITKNKLTGKARSIEFDVYYDYGIDDIGSCIDYLISRQRWVGGGNSKIKFGSDFPFESCTKPKLISLIEENGEHYIHLTNLVEEEWNAFEESLKLGRKRKYE